jgi:hypothetical protein
MPEKVVVLETPLNVNKKKITDLKKYNMEFIKKLYAYDNKKNMRNIESKIIIADNILKSESVIKDDLIIETEIAEKVKIVDVIETNVIEKKTIDRRKNKK